MDQIKNIQNDMGVTILKGLLPITSVIALLFLIINYFESHFTNETNYFYGIICLLI